MSDTFEWYCENCGYLPGSRVTFHETCDSCHVPVVLHDREVRDAEIARLVSERDEARRQRDALVAGIRAVLAPYESEINTHYEGCEEIHWRCKLRKLLREVER